MSGTPQATSEVEAYLNQGRMLSDGIPWADVEAARTAAREDSEVDWFDFWMGRSGRLHRARRAGRSPSRNGITAGELLWLASLTAHYAQYMWFHDPSRRELGQRRKVELFDRAAPHLTPPGERVEIDFEGATIPGYLRLPQHAGDGPFPCCVLIGGLESTKEESHRFENLCLERGLATFAFDGPGQGEMFFEVKLGPDFERYLLGRPGRARAAARGRLRAARRPRAQPRRPLCAEVGRGRRPLRGLRRLGRMLRPHRSRLDAAQDSGRASATPPESRIRSAPTSTCSPRSTWRRWPTASPAPRCCCTGATT